MLCWFRKSPGGREGSMKKVSWGGSGWLSLGKDIPRGWSLRCEEESDKNHAREDLIVGQGPNSWNGQLLGMRDCHVPAYLLPHPTSLPPS